jgi:hypothetical protein
VEIEANTHETPSEIKQGLFADDSGVSTQQINSYLGRLSKDNKKLAMKRTFAKENSRKINEYLKSFAFLSSVQTVGEFHQ